MMKLFDYWPDVYKRILEYQYLAQSAQPETDDVAAQAAASIDRLFVHSTTEDTIKRWETMLGIVPPPDMPLENRRLAVLDAIYGVTHYTIRLLRQSLTDEYGDGNTVTHVDYRYPNLYIRLTATLAWAAGPLYERLRKALHANLWIFVGLLNIHGILQMFTHGHLAAYTHSQLREELHL